MSTLCLNGVQLSLPQNTVFGSFILDYFEASDFITSQAEDSDWQALVRQYCFTKIKPNVKNKNDRCIYMTIRFPVPKSWRYFQ